METLRTTTPIGGITVDVLGDANPFSKTGRSSTYRVTVAGCTYLIDSGAPLFQLLSMDELIALRGVVGTHSHDDHRRWLTDLALFRSYVSTGTPRLKLISSDPILNEYRETSRAALEQSLSSGSDRVVDVAYEWFFDPISVGPRARFEVVHDFPTPDEPAGRWYVLDVMGGIAADAGVAKLVFGANKARPRLLVRDAEEQVWVEPEVYYAWGDRRFYLADTRPFVDSDSGMRIEAVKDHAWHGLPTTGVRVSAGDDAVFFSSDTVYNPELWRTLVDARPAPTRGGMSAAEFEAAPIIWGDINEFIERVWSPARYDGAMAAYAGAVVFQDTASLNSVVHTDYPQARELARRIGPEKIVLVHAPDRFVSLECLCFADKRFLIYEGKRRDIVDGKCFEPIGDVFMKEAGKYYVGLKRDALAPDARWEVVERDNGLLDVVHTSKPLVERPAGRTLFHCAMFHEVNGRLYPRLTASDETYRARKDGQVELLSTTATGSLGALVNAVAREPVVFAQPASTTTADNGRKKDSDSGVRFKQPAT